MVSMIPFDLSRLDSQDAQAKLPVMDRILQIGKVRCNVMIIVYSRVIIVYSRVIILYSRVIILYSRVIILYSRVIIPHN